MTSEIRVFICIVCGDAYLGASIPAHCPFCGAPEKYVFTYDAYKKPEEIPITETSKGNLEKALELEISNSEFYRCGAKNAKSVALEKTLARLSRIEATHAGVITDMLGLPKPIIRDVDTCPDDQTDILSEAYDREERASSFYNKAASEAVEPYVKEFFTAVVEIEHTHLVLADSLKEKISS